MFTITNGLLYLGKKQIFSVILRQVRNVVTLLQVQSKCKFQFFNEPVLVEKEEKCMIVLTIFTKITPGVTAI